jgi:hypothetical protein
MSMKNFSDTIGNRTRDLPVCSAVPPFVLGFQEMFILTAVLLLLLLPFF